MAIKAHIQKIKGYECTECDARFIFPEIKALDAGGLHDARIAEQAFCPECLSTKIERYDNGYLRLHPQGRGECNN